MKLVKRIVFISLIATLGYLISFAWRIFPILVGYGAKDLCSCVLVAGRQPEDVILNEIGKFPLSLGSFSVDFQDSSASGSIVGLAKRKAIYRKGLGCTLISEISEDELRRQEITTATPPTVEMDSVEWPMGDKLSGTMPAAVNLEKINHAIAYAFLESGEKKLRRTRAIVVVYDGQIIAEKYADGFTRSSRQIGWSMTKSITNALVGVLVKQGKLKVDSPAPIAEWQHDERNKIKLNDLLHQSSGLAWSENFTGPSDATNMLFKSKDMGSFAAQSKLAHTPGEVFYYSTGTTNILSRIVRETVGDQHYYEFPFRELFYKIGMFSAVMEPDAGGTFVGSSYSFATARDWARFGLLYLQDGIWNGERILPKGWVKYSTTPAIGAKMGQYGAHFWLNAGAPGNPGHRSCPDVPVDLFMADGYEGQNVWILPSKKLVIARLSLQQGNYLNENKFLADIIDALP